MTDNKPQEKANFPIDIKHIQVIAFAKAMDEILCKNDHKGGWQECRVDYLRSRLVEELGEYFALEAKVLTYDDFCDDIEKLIRKSKLELIDIANFAMMLWDRS